MSDKLVRGVGINDANYVVCPTINGKQKFCPYYRTWQAMLSRCYSAEYHLRLPTYSDCTVCDEWLTFSKFKAWMETQDWVGKQLDKDILFIGNKVYSPNTCVFVSLEVNIFLTNCVKSRGMYLLGVSRTGRNKKFRADCNMGDEKHYREFFDTELEAHLAWKYHKNKRACILAGKQSDPRVAEALLKRFS